MTARALLVLGAVCACRSSAQPKGQPVDAGIDARVEPGPTIGVRLASPGANASAMERRGLVAAEAALRRAPELAGLDGVAVPGAAAIDVTFQPGTPAVAAQRAVADLVRPRVATDIAVDVVPASRAELRFDVRSDTLPRVELREIVERSVLPRLARVPGVAEARACGGARREAAVLVDANRLAAVNLSLREVTAALARAAPYAAADDLGTVVAAVRAGVPLRIADVGRIEIGAAPPDCWVASPDGRPGVAGRVTVADAQALAAAGAALDRARAELPAGVTIDRRPESTLRLTVRAPAGAREPALAQSVAALRDAAPTAVAWRDLRGAAADELELWVPAGSVGAVARALARVPMLGPVRTPDDEIRVAVAGSDLEPLAAAAEAVRAALASVPGVAAVGTVGASPRDAPRVDVRPDPQALARAGLGPDELDAYVRAATRGVPVARLRDGERDIDVSLRLLVARDDAAALARLVVPTAGGAIPIASLARITLLAEPREIVHRDGERVALVWVRRAEGADRRGLAIAVWGAASSATLPAGVRLLGPGR